ncbi:phage portal protein [Burkholderia vietnamiensis]|uniref:phage portal protein n=1 Tax=Burkholderia vietnamiensis TaxID=60552 RepID=UPI00158BBB0A|nr:phage portal protein [Burkholderia vietnamiensis]
MWLDLKSQHKQDKDLPQRSFDNQCYYAVLDGTQYDVLQYSFHTEHNEANEYIKLRDRRPSVRYALCRAVVDDSVGLLFSEEHFPTPKCEANPDVAQQLGAIIKETRLNQIMIDAATQGSVGSVAILMRVLKGRIFFDVMRTTYLTPEWKADEPDTLARVVEQYKTKGSALKALGYPINDDELAADFWFRRDWDLGAENWYMPWPVQGADPDATPTLDEGRTVKHGLGFVPMVWIKNLPGGNGIDGECTFKLAIDTSIEIDYILSQGGRGLKYASDPTLLIKEPASGGGSSMVKGGGKAIVVDKDGDAKLLEMSGDSTTAILEYVRLARQIALESIHGNKSDADKIAAAQSGRAMELMNQALIWLADKLRISYGECGLLEILNMIVRVSNKHALKTKKGKPIGKIPVDPEITLKWPPWYAPTWADKTNESNTLTALTSAGILSKETATESIADEYDIEDTKAESGKIQAEAKAAQDAQISLAKATKPVPDNTGD